MHMTLRRLGALASLALATAATPVDQVIFERACDQRICERGTSKLGRRMRRNVELGRAGAH